MWFVVFLFQCLESRLLVLRDLLPILVYFYSSRHKAFFFNLQTKDLQLQIPAIVRGRYRLYFSSRARQKNLRSLNPKRQFTNLWRFVEKNLVRGLSISLVELSDQFFHIRNFWTDHSQISLLVFLVLICGLAKDSFQGHPHSDLKTQEDISRFLSSLQLKVLW